MVMKTTFSLLFLILAITCTVIAQSTGYRKFMKQHYKRGMRRSDCNRVMATINERYNDDECKEVNTFITGPRRSAITAVCGHAGQSFHRAGIRNLRESTNPFSLITCIYTGGSGLPPCNYHPYAATNIIVIACDRNGLPVHYHTDHPRPDHI